MLISFVFLYNRPSGEFMCMYRLQDVMFLCVINYKPNNQVPVLKGSLEKLHLICQKKAFSSSIKRKPCFPFLVGCSFPVEFYRRVSDIYCFFNYPVIFCVNWQANSVGQTILTCLRKSVRILLSECRVHVSCVAVRGQRSSRASYNSNIFSWLWYLFISALPRCWRFF